MKRRAKSSRNEETVETRRGGTGSIKNARDRGC